MNVGFTLIKFTEKEIEVLKLLTKNRFLTSYDIAHKLGIKTGRTIDTRFFQIYRRHKVKTRQEAVALFKERYVNVGASIKQNSIGHQLMQNA